MKADLHIHSTASDGQYAPAELVAMAKQRGIEVLALTDHDNIGGVDEAVAAGDHLDLRVLRGIELSADDYLDLHILGYEFSPAVMQEHLDLLKRGRDARKYRIAEYLQRQGVGVELSEVERLAAGGVIGRPHFAEAMVARGYVATREEAFARYLDTPAFHAIDRGKPSAETCVRKIKEAGGMVSLAHPYQIVLDKTERLEDLVRRLKGYGLDAIECYYPRHTPEQTAGYLALAKKYGLHVTGGSDFHGEKRKPSVELSTWELELDWLLR